MAVNELTAEDLYRTCDSSRFSFETTADLDPPEGVLGQPRAVAAVEFGTSIDGNGYNLFVLGELGTGRHTVVRQFLERRARDDPPPSDWCYVHNFNGEQQPRLLRLPSGMGEQLRKDMKQLVEELQTTLTSALESEDYQTQRMTLEEELTELQTAAFVDVKEKAEQAGLRVIPGPTGFIVAPVREGKMLSPQEIEKMSPEERSRLEKATEDLQEGLQKSQGQMPRLQREHRERVRELNRRVTRFAAGTLIEDLRHRYRDESQIVAYFDAVEADVVEHTREFVQHASGEPSNPLQAALAEAQQDRAFLRRYLVNPIVNNSETQGAPVIHEDHPTHANLIGRIEHFAQFGSLVTDFHLIRAGALHRANGGYLILDALELLRQPYAWESLKRALRAGQLKIESLGESLGLIPTVSLQPEPIPLALKVVLIGEPWIYYLLCARDPDFPDLFKVVVDFDERMPRDAASEEAYAQVVAGIVREEQVEPFDRGAVAQIIERAARQAADGDRLSLKLGKLRDLIREADHWARMENCDLVGAQHVQRAVEQQIYRSDRMREHIQEELLRGTLQISTEGVAIGQINGLSVLQLGDLAFGRPSRITARVWLGAGEVVDIEREVKLAGPLHSKGVLILAGFLGERYAAELPLSLSASLVFEQSYAGVEGDSASLAELYALLSAVAGVALRQSLAVTGSINQHGQVQAIGGVNEKIEAFFDLCHARGLSGDQGVVIPSSNVAHLMLRQDVVEAVRGGRFHVYAVGSVNDGVEILTGLPAGEAAEDGGGYPEESFNLRVQERLVAMARRRKEFGSVREEAPHP